MFRSQFVKLDPHTPRRDRSGQRIVKFKRRKRDRKERDFAKRRVEIAVLTAAAHWATGFRGFRHWPKGRLGGKFSKKQRDGIVKGNCCCEHTFFYPGLRKLIFCFWVIFGRLCS